MQIIQHQELSSAQASITFSSIPQTFTDLVLIGSTRASDTGVRNITLRFNGDTSANYSFRMLFSFDTGSPASDFNLGSTFIRYFYSNGSNSTADTFSSWQLYAPNYTASTAKSVSYDHTTEQNGTSPMIQGISAGLWNNTTAINSITLAHETGANFAQYSSVSLYGILKGSSGTTVVS